MALGQNLGSRHLCFRLNSVWRNLRFSPKKQKFQFLLKIITGPASLAWMPLSPGGFQAGKISCGKKGLAEKYKTLVKPGRKVEEHGF